MPEAKLIAHWAVQALEHGKAENVTILNLQKISLVADYFIIASGRSTVQVRAIAERVREFLKGQAVPLLHAEGTREGIWILLDYGSVVVHVFRREEREFYQLERLWGDAVVMAPEAIGPKPE